MSAKLNFHGADNKVIKKFELFKNITNKNWISDFAIE